ncbi:heme ABC transporter substrate-binding protein IsdE [[Clostridium] symbiosum]|uniref:heme ABC transporter substrate-binding protein IsdE n=1 Tax=Clostridium symbiosum TaxID=1512 RepID=UPI001AA1A33B|nr:heme ABC transporter substrate-binding protein IsdE [[Clostridium] symbiosum]MBO1695257.1 heme ABC transporter substrate-binding protein IsdE [[Clostridium] symbiosum]
MRRKQRTVWMAAFSAAALLLSGCVNQNAHTAAAGEADELRIVATSPAVVDIMARLDIDLVGVPNSTLSEIPARYDDATRTGTAMGPDMEVIKTLNPDWVIGPASLQTDMEPKLEAAGLNGIFLNLESVEGLYKSVEQLGEFFGRQEEAQEMIDEFSAFYYEYSQVNVDKGSPTVLVLMGLPGSYVVATGKSYVGSLVRLAGGTNVYEDEETDFIIANTEDMQTKDPDIILRAAHAMPEDVVNMFKEEFETNDIWRHFRAVEDGCVYDLPYDQFGMSAKFNFPEALDTLQPMLYGE